MNKDETLQVMAILQATYPSFYKGIAPKVAETAVDLWTDMFAEDDYKIVLMAVKALLATDEKGFPPHIGAVKAKIRLLTTQQGMTEGEAWGLVLKAMENGIYGYKEEYAALPPDVQYAIGSADVLRTWAMQETDSLSVTQSNFMRSYRARREYAREWAALPESVKGIAGSLVGKFDMNKLLQEGE